MKVEVSQHETSGIGSFLHNKGTLVKKSKKRDEQDPNPAPIKAEYHPEH